LKRRTEQERYIAQTISMVERLLRCEEVPLRELDAFVNWLRRGGQIEGLEMLNSFAEKAAAQILDYPDPAKLTQIEEVSSSFISFVSSRSKRSVARKELLFHVTGDFLGNISWKRFLEGNRYVTRFPESVQQALEIGYDLHAKAIIMEDSMRVEERENFEKLLKRSESSWTPLIMLGPSSPRRRMQAYEAGADDYWDESVSFDERLLRLRRLIRKSDVVSKTVLVDELTGAFNRKYLNGAFERRRSRAGQEGVFGLAIFDLDHFKRINDTFGHPVGDVILSEVASVIKDALRPEDELIRYGGEEFMVLFSCDHQLASFRMMERIRERVSSHSFDRGLRVTISIGFTLITDPDMTLPVASMQADEALYKAKRTGRDRVVGFDRTLTTEKIKAAISLSLEGEEESVSELLHAEHVRYDFEIRKYISPGTESLELLVLPLKEIAADDFRLLEWLKHERGRETQFMAIAQSEDELLAEAMRRGVVDYTVLPLDSESLAERIRQWVIHLA